MLGYLEVKSTKRFDDWYASLRDKIAKKAVDRRIARVAAGLFGDVKREKFQNCVLMLDQAIACTSPQ